MPDNWVAVWLCSKKQLDAARRVFAACIRILRGLYYIFYFRAGEHGPTAKRTVDYRPAVYGTERIRWVCALQGRYLVNNLTDTTRLLISKMHIAVVEIEYQLVASVPDFPIVEFGIRMFGISVTFNLEDRRRQIIL